MIRFSFILIAFFTCLARGESQETIRQLNLFSEVFRYVKNKSARPISDEALIESAIQGLLSAVDSHSAYITAEKYQDLLGSLKSAFGGIGVEFTMKNGHPTIVSPLDGTPAHSAGLKPGDILLEIDDQSLSGLPLSLIRDKLKGEIGESITLKVKRDGDIKSFEIKRDRINIEALKWHMKDQVLIIRLSHFNEGIAGRLQKILRQNMASAMAIILDLTNNPGGFFDEALGVTNLFLESGTITSVVERDKKEKIYRAASDKVIASKTPLFVLINEGTASSAEIVASALGENNRAKLIGRKSFGKGSVQTILPVPPGYTAIQLTTGFYKTPKGHLIDGRGIVPTLRVEGDDEALLDSALTQTKQGQR